MAPGTHALLGWWTANVLPLNRWDRFLVFMAGLLPDLDGLGLLISSEAYFTYHHILCHNLAGCLIFVALVSGFAQDRRPCVLLVFLNWHLHLACDYFGSRGPMTTPPWVLPYLYPAVGGWSEGQFIGPRWYWNPWQWPLDGWPNLLIGLIAVGGWLYIAVRLDRTFFEFIWPRIDREICQTLRKVLGGQAVKTWSETEALVIRRSYLLLGVFTLLACVVAASQAT